MMPSGYVPSDFVTHTLSKHAKLCRVRARRGRKLTHVPVEMRDTCNEFLHSIAEKNSRTILIKKVNSVTGEVRETIIPYIHRHCDYYLNLVRAKMHYAQEYFGDGCQFFFISLTVAHGNIDYEECLSRVKLAKRKLVRKIRDWGFRTYQWINDVHQSGYDHAHLLVKGVISPDQILKLKLFWSCKLKIGSYAHGLDVRIPNTDSLASCVSDVDSSESSCEPGVLKSVVGYFMKYLVKHLTSNFDEPKFLVFNAVLWKTRSRLFGFSRDVSAYIKEKMNEYKEIRYGKKEASNWVYDGAAICDNEGIVLSEIPKRRAKPVITETDVYLYTVRSAFLNSLKAGQINRLIDSGHYITKYVGDCMVEVYERIVNVVI